MEREGARERKRGRRRGALLLDNLFSYRASSRLRLDKCSDGCVWGENSRGWLVERWRGDTGKERERGTEGEMDHPVSACIMEKKGKRMNQTGNEICRLLFTHTINDQKPKKLTTRK